MPSPGRSRRRAPRPAAAFGAWLAAVDDDPLHLRPTLGPPASVIEGKLTVTPCAPSQVSGITAAGGKPSCHTPVSKRRRLADSFLELLF